MTLPLFPACVPSYVQHMAVTATILAMGLGWVPLVLIIAWANDIPKMDALIPLFVRLFFTLLLITSIGQVCKVANRRLVLIVAFVAGSLFLLKITLLTEEDVPIEQSLKSILLKVLAASLPEATAHSFAVFVSVMVPYWIGLVSSGMHILYSGALAGSLYGGIANLIQCLGAMKNADKLRPEFKYFVWLEGCVAITTFCAVGVVTGTLAVTAACNLTSNKTLAYLGAFVAPLVMLWPYMVAIEMHRLNQDSWQGLLPVLMYFSTITIAGFAVRGILRQKQSYVPLVEP